MGSTQRKIIPVLEPENAPISLSAFLRPEKARRIRLPNSPKASPNRTPLGQILLDRGAIEPQHLIKALSLRIRQDVRLGDILLAHGWVDEAALMSALSAQWSAPIVDLIAQAPDPRLIDAIGPEACLRDSFVPWRRVGGVTLVATARPEEFHKLREQLPPGLAPYRMVLAPERDVHESLLARRQTALIRRAEVKVDPEKSCRSHNEARAARFALALLTLSAVGLWLAPIAVFMALFSWVVLSLVLSTGLKLLAARSEIKARRENLAPLRAGPKAPIRLPIISIMVPLFHEHDIAERLIARLGKLDYPRELLDILLVVEQGDLMTRTTLAEATLPRWMRVVTVPDGPIKTKPRAMNYALNFCRGSVIGVYDAEDAPDPDQLHIIARRFAEAPPEVACLQGMLDYYNPRTNWLARCFTIEYAAWWRTLLPGVARMGLVIPLGGTTLFFRREALEELGGWDAHNVTEDADLGIRLARHGYRTELVRTVTHEEANCRAMPWVKQRSRWLKGYAMTWAVHMRNPRRLWQELGPKRFLGIQILVLGSLTQFIFAPVLWSMWLVPLGVWHPVDTVLSTPLRNALIGLFVLTEGANIAVGIWAVSGKEHRHLIPWVPTLHFYFPLGALAGWKALYEMIVKPFYWDKTSHGVFDLNAQKPRASALVPQIVAATPVPAPPPRTRLAPLID